MPYNRFQHGGGAVTTALTADLAPGGLSCIVNLSTNWPDGTVGPFWIVVDPEQSNEEKILATARTGNTLTGLTRGADGTSPSAHSSGAVVRHIASALELDEANQVVKQTLGSVTAKGTNIVATASGVLGTLTVGANNTILIADSSTATGQKWGLIPQASLGVDSVGAPQIIANAVGTAELSSAVAGTALSGGSGSPLTVIVDGTTIDKAGGFGSLEVIGIPNGIITLGKFSAGLRPVFVVADAAALGALTPGAGDLAVQLDTKYLLEYSGSAWVGVTDHTVGRGNARRWRELKQAQTTATEDLNFSNNTFPTINTYSVALPAWAKWAYVRATIGQAYAITSTVNHAVWVAVGSVDGAHRRLRWEPATPPQATARDISLNDKLDVSAAAGTTVTVRTMGNRVSGTGGIRVSDESIHSIDIEITEQ